MSVSDTRIPIQELKSHVNTLLIGGRSVGSVAPGTLGFVIHGIEQSASSGTKKSFDGSKAFGVGDLLEIQIECRRKKPSGTKPEEILAKNLEAAQNTGGSPEPYGYYGSRLPCGSTAHHIVAKGSNARFPAVAQSQAILAKYGIDINDASNGVVLRDKVDAPLEGAYHRTLHTGVYHNEVFTRLDNKDNTPNVTKAVIQQELHQIRLELLSDTFPH